MDKSEFYQNNLNFIINYFTNSSINKIIPISDIFDAINFVKIFSNVLNSLTGLAGNFSLVLIYLIFLIVEEKNFLIKLNKVSKNKNKNKILTKINNDIFKYFRLKTFTSLLTGILTFLILQIIGNDLSTVFGIFAFFLNFIPFIGSLFSIIFPFIFSCIQFLNFFDPLITLILLISIQIFVGNFLEPKFMGKTLNISPIVMLTFLSIMGKLWGVFGMFLSVPMLVVLLIILNNFKATRKFAILIAEK
jgi:predicted PurR-regulated permease PerM